MADKVKIRLQGHEKFSLREGWLTKGLTIIENNPKAFLDKYAPDDFGIGSNMVKSLRYWMKAFGLIEEHGAEGAELTEYAKLILKYDKYFEDVFSVWLLHSNIVGNVSEATTWYMFFNKCDLQDFGKNDIERVIGREIDKYTNNQGYAEKSLKNDIDVLLNMYSKDKTDSDPEEKNTSPMSQLGLVKQGYNEYSRKRPDRRIVNEWLVLYEIAKRLQNEESISIDSIAVGDNSLSNIYQMDLVTINELLDQLDEMEYIRITRTAGLDTIYKVKDITAVQVIEEYYKSR